jgi:HAD superfamily hydrolase (TIGR01484 family)
MSVNRHGNPTEKSVPPLPALISPLPSIIFTDVDDTLTFDGQLPVETYTALHQLRDAGFTVIPVTGASAGWCDCLIKTWPIQHIIGENGALNMEKDANGIVSTIFEKDSESVKHDLAKLKQMGNALTDQFPTIKFTQDQQFRITDIAFDIGQTVLVPESLAVEATEWLAAKGVQARRSSIHINVWMGNHSKSTGAMAWLKQRNMDEHNCLFIGDSPNDESMFKQFPLSVGVANIERFLATMEYVPAFVTVNQGGYGFVDMANLLLKSHSAAGNQS